MSDYLRLSEAPTWCISYPTCSACEVDLDHDGDDWHCPSCGTAWDRDATDGDTGELYRDWAGEEATGPEVTPDEAWQVADLSGDDRDRRLARIRQAEAIRESQRSTPTRTETSDD